MVCHRTTADVKDGARGATADTNVKRIRLLDTLKHCICIQFEKSREQIVQERHVRI